MGAAIRLLPRRYGPICMSRNPLSATTHKLMHQQEKRRSGRAAPLAAPLARCILGRTVGRRARPPARGDVTTQRGIMATPFPALLRSRGRPSPLHRARGKGSALPTHPRLRRGYPTERGGPPPLVGLSPGLCGPGGTVAYITHRTVTHASRRDKMDWLVKNQGMQMLKADACVGGRRGRSGLPGSCLWASGFPVARRSRRPGQGKSLLLPAHDALEHVVDRPEAQPAHGLNPDFSPQRSPRSQSQTR
jgi:hypothetical protein